MGPLLSLTKAATFGGRMCDSLLSILSRIIACVPIAFRLTVWDNVHVDVSDGKVPCGVAFVLVTKHYSASAVWRAPLAPLSAHGGMIPLAHLTYFAFKHCRDTAYALAFARTLVHTIAQQFELNFADSGNCLSEFPSGARRPLLDRESYVAKAERRGDDKRMLFFRRFLTKDVGFATSD